MHEDLSPDVANYLGKKSTIHLDGMPIDREIDIHEFQRVSPELSHIAENVARISGTWNPVEIYTADPSSIDGEKQKLFEAFYKGEEYNPKFTYSYAKDLDLEEGRKALSEELTKLRHFGKKQKKFWQFWQKNRLPGKLTLDRPTRLFRAALYFKIKDDLATCDLALGLRTDNEDLVAKALARKYPGTDQSLYNLAVEGITQLIHENHENNKSEALLSDEEKAYLEEKEFDAFQIADAFRWSLDQYGMLHSPSNPKGFKVKIDPKATSIDVRDKSVEGATVFVPQDRKMSGKTLLGIIAHEIEGHARQSLNGEKLFKLGGGKLKIDNEQLYEGLGLRYETDIKKKLFGEKEVAPRPFYVFASKMAEEGKSFYEIFKNQVELRLRIALKKPMGDELPSIEEVDKEILEKAKDDAWLTTYRIMRGHLDTSNKKAYAMNKDLGYLRGFQMDTQLKNNDLGFLNEEGIIASGALAMLAELKLSEKDMPIPFKDVATKYWEQVLKPKMQESKSNANVLKEAEDVAAKAWEEADRKERQTVTA